MLVTAQLVVISTTQRRSVPSIGIEIARHVMVVPNDVQ
jgi:hypothetical protein